MVRVCALALEDSGINHNNADHITGFSLIVVSIDLM